MSHTGYHGFHHPSLGALTQLLLLDVSHNHLESVPEEIGHCVSLTTLDVQHNNLTKIPSSVGNLVMLKRFGLRYHLCITIVTDHIRALIRYNKLSELPAEIVQCVHLEELSLENNAIVSLPRDLYGCLEKLSSVQLSRNNFDTFPIVDPGHLAHMNSLNIEHNHITKIPHAILSKVNTPYCILHTAYFIPCRLLQ